MNEDYEDFEVTFKSYRFRVRKEKFNLFSTREITKDYTYTVCEGEYVGPLVLSDRNPPKELRQELKNALKFAKEQAESGYADMTPLELLAKILPD